MLNKAIRSYSGVTAFLIGIFLTLGLLRGIDKIFYFLNNYQKQLSIYDKVFYQHDDNLCYKPKVNKSGYAISKIGKKVIYDTHYSIDGYGRRVTPVNNLKGRNNFILFFGCSFTFGLGVSDDETLPFYVSELTPHYMPYNYGCGGYGPQNMLAKLQSGEIAKEITEKNGLAIYTFIDHHISRATGTVIWGRNLPCYIIDSDGKLVRKNWRGLMSGRSILSYFYSRLNNTQIFKYFKIELPLRCDDESIQLTCRIIEESRNVFREKFKSDKFYVLIYPGTYYTAEILTYLKKSGIRYLDYSHLLDVSNKEFTIDTEVHPTSKAYKIVAEHLVNDIPNLQI